MAKLNLTKVTLVAITSNKIEETIKALNICENYCDFYDSILFTDNPVPHKHVIIEKINNIKGYDNFVVKYLPYHIRSEFCLTIHWDGFIVNPKAWTDEFFEYDYIGSPWPHQNDICGNGGFCLKSKKFLNLQKHLTKNIEVLNPDDEILAILLRDHFENFGCKYAPPEIAYKFATEQGDYYKNNSFGFHDFKHNPQFIENLLN